MKVSRVPTTQGPAWIVDDIFEEDTLTAIDNLRLSLSLDQRRPTVDRRFFADDVGILHLQSNFLPQSDLQGRHVVLNGQKKQHKQQLEIDMTRPISSLLEVALIYAIHEIEHCRIFRYQRFLEYSKIQNGLDPHTDGHKICDDTKIKSTHTMLPYLTTCSHGGETVLLKSCKLQPDDDDDDDDEANTIHSIKPHRGRMLVFPHLTPHAAAPTLSVPKICLRAEVHIQAVPPETSNSYHSYQ